MTKIAFLFDSGVITWPSVILTLSALGALLLFLSLYLKDSDRPLGGFLTALIAAAASVPAARFVHWYCFPGSYAGMEAAMGDLSTGGFALVGVFAVCIAAALVTRVLQLHKNLPFMLDCMSLAGAAGIAVGRLASFFDASDRGQLLETVRNMPWAYPVVNAVSGATEYRLATFLLQAMVAGGLFLILLVRHLAFRKRRDGDTALLFLLCYGASQVVLDSTRYDSIYFRSNGFVSIVQVLSALALGLVIVVFSVRMVRAEGFRKYQAVLWGVMAALIGCAGYMEYHVQRHGNEALFAYSVMSGCLLAVVLLTLIIRGHGVKHKFLRPRA